MWGAPSLGIVPLIAARPSLECVTMKNVAVLFALLFAAARAHAQVRIEVQLDQEQYLPNEALVARVKIHNSSGQTLRLGEAANWLSFVIESTDGKEYVRPIKTPELQGAFPLESSSIATKKVDLSALFDLTRVGSYRVVATVNVPAFRENYASPSKQFIIGNGSRLGQDLTFGVPNSAGPDGKPEVRKYRLIQTNPGSEARLFVRVMDMMDKNFKVVPIGGLVSFSRPEPQLDRWSNLHLLYQTGARSMLYTEINPEGMVLAKETHEITDTRPSLVANDEGRILVRGGTRRYTSNDIPPVDPVLASAANQIPVPAPVPGPVTNSATKKSSGKDAKEKTTKR
jgi:hypothetical protein